MEVISNFELLLRAASHINSYQAEQKRKVDHPALSQTPNEAKASESRARTAKSQGMSTRPLVEEKTAPKEPMPSRPPPVVDLDPPAKKRPPACPPAALRAADLPAATRPKTSPKQPPPHPPWVPPPPATAAVPIGVPPVVPTATYLASRVLGTFSC